MVSRARVVWLAGLVLLASLVARAAAGEAGGLAAQGDTIPPDVPGHWAATEIMYLHDRGVLDWVTGPQGRPVFLPDRPITRCDLAVWLCRLFDLAPVSDVTFTDLAGTAERGYIEAAAKHGIIHGVGDGRFAPVDAISRAAVATLLSRFYRLTEETTTPFPDVPTGHWAERHIRRAALAGLILGYGQGFFRPDATITRAEAAAVVARAARTLAMPSLADFPLAQRLERHGWPRLFVQIQGYTPEATTLREAASWDVLVLDAELVVNEPEWLGAKGALRGHNPDSVVLAYFSAADVIPGNTAIVNHGFIDGVEDAWYARDTAGARLRLFPLGDKWSEMLDLTGPVNEFMPRYLADEVLGKGLVDGLFYDWICDGMAWVSDRSPSPSGPLDLDRDGGVETDTEVDAAWVDGTRRLLANSRAAFPAGSLILGNGGWAFDDRYRDILNGRMVEEFLVGEASAGLGWLEVMRGHYIMGLVCEEPRVQLIMANGRRDDYRLMRYALASALMFDGYFCYTNRGAYQSAWWYDEYAVDRATGKAERSLEHKGYLGAPLGEAWNADNPGDLLGDLLALADSRAETEVWRRDFEHGVVLVNPTGQRREVELGGRYRRIAGLVDPAFNDGTTLTAITLEPRSGAVLLLDSGE